MLAGALATLMGGIVAGCTPRQVGQVATAIHAQLYLPRALPSGVRFESARRLGPHMAFILYRGSHGRSLSIFESPEPIARPPGAAPSGGLYELVQSAGTGPVTSIWLHRPGAYVQMMGANIERAETESAARSLAPAGKP